MRKREQERAERGDSRERDRDREPKGGHRDGYDDYEYYGQNKRIFKQRMVERESRGRNSGGPKFFDEKVNSKKRADSLDRTQGVDDES